MPSPLLIIPKTGIQHKNSRGVHIIGACKLIYGLVLGAAGFGIFHLLNKDLGVVVERVIFMLHLDPENRISHAFLRLVGLDQRQLEAIGAGTFLFALLEMIEGIGLMLSRHWAEYLTIIDTSILLLPECYEIAMKMRLLRIAVFVINLSIVIYLIYQLEQDQRHRPIA